MYNKDKVDTLTQKKQHIQIYSAILPIERNIDKQISLPQMIIHWKVASRFYSAVDELLKQWE